MGDKQMILETMITNDARGTQKTKRKGGKKCTERERYWHPHLTNVQHYHMHTIAIKRTDVSAPFDLGRASTLKIIKLF